MYCIVMHEMSTAVHSSQWTNGRSLNMASHVFVHVQSKTPYFPYRTVIKRHSPCDAQTVITIQNKRDTSDNLRIAQWVRSRFGDSTLCIAAGSISTLSILFYFNQLSKNTTILSEVEVHSVNKFKSYARDKKFVGKKKIAPGDLLGPNGIGRAKCCIFRSAQQRTSPHEKTI